MAQSVDDELELLDIGSFRDVPGEIVRDILLNTKAADVISLCRTNTYFRENVCQTEFGGLWKQLYQRDIASVPLRGPSKTWREEYFRVMTEFNNVLPDDKNLVDKNNPDYRDVFRWAKILAQIDFAVKNRYKNLLFNLLKEHPYGVTALDSAATYGYLDIVEELIQSGYSPYLQNVFTAAKNGHYDIVNYFMLLPDDLSAPFNKENRLNEAMKGAAEGNQEDLLIQLIDYNTNNYPNELARNINDAFFHAAKAHLLEIGDLLVNNGGNINSALIGAAAGGHLDLVQEYLDEGATQIDQAFLYAVNEHQLPVVKFFRENYPNEININQGLINAAGWDSFNILNYLIGQGATNKNEALLHAINSGMYKSAITLILNGANDFYNAVMATIESIMRNGTKERLIKLLLDKALLDGRRLQERQLLEISIRALDADYSDVIKHLLELDFDPLYEASRYGTPDQVRTLLDLGSSLPFNVNQALINASAKGNLEIVHELLRRGAGTDYYQFRLKNPERQWTGEQALDQAIENAAIFNHKEIVNELLEYGADIHSAFEGAIRDPDFRSIDFDFVDSIIRDGLVSGDFDLHKALRMAAATNNLPLVQLVMKYVANQKLRPSQEDLDIAMGWAISRYNPNWELIEYLLRQGADPQKAIQKSQTPQIKEFIRDKSSQINNERSRYRRSRGK